MLYKDGNIVLFPVDVSNIRKLR